MFPLKPLMYIIIYGMQSLLASYGRNIGLDRGNLYDTSGRELGEQIPCQARRKLKRELC